MSRPIESHITGHCERCGADHDVVLPERASRDLGLTHVPAAFRFCVRCGRYVGRPCCWRPAAVACADCAETAVPILATGAAARSEGPALGHMRSAVDELGQLAASLEESRANRRRSPDWIDSWTTAGLLDARVQSARDAIAKEIWNLPYEARAGAIGLDMEVRRLATLRDAALARTEVELLARRPAARRAGRPVSVRRAAWTGVAVAFLVAGIAGVASGAWTEMIWADARGSATPTTDAPASERAVASSASQPSIVATPSGLVTAGEWTFDDLRMGPVTGAPDLIAAGGAEIVAVPTSIDRSVRLPADSTVCIGANDVFGDEGTVLADLHLASDLSPASELAVVLAISADETYRLALRAGDIRPLDDEEWIRLRLRWSDLPAFTVEASSREDGASLLRTSMAGELLQEPSDAAVCIWHIGDPRSGDILLDNVRLESSG